MIGNALEEEAVMEDEVMGLSTNFCNALLGAFTEQSRTMWVLHRTAGSATSLPYHQRAVLCILNGMC